MISSTKRSIKREKSNLAGVIQENFHKFWWKKEGFLASNPYIFLTIHFDYIHVIPFLKAVGPRKIMASKKWSDLTLPNLRIHSPFLHPNYSSRCNGNHPKQSSWCKQFLDLKQSSRCDQFWFPCPSDATACGKSGQSVDYCSYKRSPLSAIRSRAKNGVLLFCFGK